MKLDKASVLLIIVVLSPFIGGIYGGLHDQLTYTISPEYYTKFKFYQFGLATEGTEALFPYPRLQVFQVGFMATWWMGLLIGFILGLTGLGLEDGKQMLKGTINAILLTMLIAFVVGLWGLIQGVQLAGRAQLPSWYFPENLIDYKSFIKVGSMHNYSYGGGILGLIVGTFYLVKKAAKVGLAFNPISMKKNIVPLVIVADIVFAILITIRYLGQLLDLKYRYEESIADRRIIDELQNTAGLNFALYWVILIFFNGIIFYLYRIIKASN